MKIFNVLTVAMVTIIGSWGTSARAFTLEGNSVSKGWDTVELSVKINPTSCPVPAGRLIAAMDQAIELWNGVPTSGLHLVRGDSVTTSATQIVAGNAVAGLPNPLLVCDPALDYTIAASGDSIAGSTLVESTQGQVITYGYILLNAVAGAQASVEKMTSTQLAIVIAHEMGHLIGLGHTQDRNSLMYFDGSLRTELSLSQDDMDGVSFLYPRSELGKSGVFGCSTVNSKGLRDSRGTARRTKKSPPSPFGPGTGEVGGLFVICLFGTWIFKRGLHIKSFRG